MKIIIKESKLEMLMTEYLDSWVSTKSISKDHEFIVFHGEEGDDVMEYDGSDGVLWINQKTFDVLMDLFGKNIDDVDEMLKFIGRWFENKFGVQVIRVE